MAVLSVMTLMKIETLNLNQEISLTLLSLIKIMDAMYGFGILTSQEKYQASNDNNFVL